MISAVNFYGENSSRVKICLGVQGITSTRIRTRIEVPDASSDVASEDEHGSTVAERPSPSATTVERKSDGFSNEEENPFVSPQVSSSLRRVTNARWRSRPGPRFDSSYKGDLLPPPPLEEHSSLEFFKMFFDDELISF